jgi:hypothetical protein
LTSTYQALVSTVAADAAVAPTTTATTPPANASATTAANPDRQGRDRHERDRGVTGRGSPMPVMAALLTGRSPIVDVNVHIDDGEMAELGARVS